jgi:hypothetical protein
MMFRSIGTALGVLAASGVVGLGPVAVSAPADAKPVCESTFIKTALVGETWRVTAAHSDWGTGGTRVTVAKGKKATNTVRTIKTSTHNFKIGVEYGPIKAEYNYTHTKTDDITNSTTTTIKTSYSRKVPRKHQARMMRWGIQEIVRATKYRWVYSPAKRTCVTKKMYSVRLGAPAADGPFIWDMQDRATGRPGCKLKSYVSYGSCPKITN